MKVLPGIWVSKVVVPGDAPWPLRASHGRRWDFPHFAVGFRFRRKKTWLILPLGIKWYAARRVADRRSSARSAA